MKILFLIITEITTTITVFISNIDFSNTDNIFNTDKFVNIENYKDVNGNYDRTKYEFLFFTHYRKKTYVLLIIPKHIALSSYTISSLIYNECSMCITVDNIKYSYLNNNMDKSRLYDNYVLEHVITENHSSVYGLFNC